MKNYKIMMIKENEQINKCLFVVYYQGVKHGHIMGLPVEIHGVDIIEANKEGGALFDYFEMVELLTESGIKHDEVEKMAQVSYYHAHGLKIGKTTYNTKSDRTRLEKRLKRVRAWEVEIV